MRIVKHILIDLGVLFLILGVPLLRSGFFASLTGDADAVTGASVVIDQPSGEYRVYINREKHEAAGTLPVWEGFFRGEDVDFVFENILCYVGNGDASGLEMARSFQSVLPENQMEIRQMDMTLMLSRADHGKFDVLVLSKEMADAFGAPLTLLERENTEELMIKG